MPFYLRGDALSAGIVMPIIIVVVWSWRTVAPLHELSTVLTVEWHFFLIFSFLIFPVFFRKIDFLNAIFYNRPFITLHTKKHVLVGGRRCNCTSNFFLNLLYFYEKKTKNWFFDKCEFLGSTEDLMRMLPAYNPQLLWGPLTSSMSSLDILVVINWHMDGANSNCRPTVINWQI